jgi:hypothetical protein
MNSKKKLGRREAIGSDFAPLFERFPLDRWIVGSLDRWIVGSLDRWELI